MDSIRHAFTKSRSSSTSTPPPLVSKSRDPPTTDGSAKSGKHPQSRESMSSKRDSGVGRSALSSLGSTNARNHSRNPSGTSSRSVPRSIGSLNVSDRLEAVLARTDDLDAVNVAHLAQSISEMRGKSHGLHGINPGMLANDISPPGSSHSRNPTQPDFVHFSPATLSRARKAKAYFEIRMTGMRVAQADGNQWNLLQCLRDREVRRKSGEQLDIRLFEGRIRHSWKAGSTSSFGDTDSIGDGRRGRKRHSSPVQPPVRGHIRQQGSRHHADRFCTSTKGFEYWSITPEEVLTNYGWQQANPHRMVNRRNELINPPPDEERRSDGVASVTSSFEFDRKAHTRYSSDGGQLSPQVSLTSPLTKTPSLKSPLRNVPSFAMPSASLTRSRSPSPTRGSNKHNRPTPDFRDIPQRVRKTLQDKIKGDRSGVSSRTNSPNRSDTAPPHHSVTAEINLEKAPRSSTLPTSLRLNMDILARRPTIVRRARNSIFSSQQDEKRRDLARTRARLASTGITARAMIDKDTPTTSIAKCQALMGTIAGLNRTLTVSFEQDHPKAATDLSATLSTLESRQTQLANQVQSALTKTRTQIAVKIADIAAEQTSTLLLQVKAVEDKMDALEYRTKSGWTHERTLHLVFLILEYIVMVVLWHLWLLLSVLRLARQMIWVVWIVVWAIITGIRHFVAWLLFMYP